MPFPIHNPFISKILPVTLLKSKVLTLVVRYRSDSKRSGGGWRSYVQNLTCTKEKAAPLVAVFDEWVPRTPTAGGPPLSPTTHSFDTLLTLCGFTQLYLS